MKNYNALMILGMLVLTFNLMAKPPVAPEGKKWVRVEDLSDEFETGFDESKWIREGQNWKGRKPGLFKASQVVVENGNLQITVDTLPKEEQVDGWTHAGGYVGSVHAAKPSYHGYFECRMKANKTFMSSTFWLINNQKEGTGCDKRTTELDIQECVGQINTDKAFAQYFDETIHSNTHSRATSCDDTPKGTVGDDAPIGGKVYDDYHVYAAWWKSPTEVVFYVDDKEKFRVNPVADFNLNMYLRMVVETYNWNVTPNDGGVVGKTFEERTTYYDWVRSWKLVDVDK